MSHVAFAAIWVGLVLLAIALDWIGNPQRGRFRPAGVRAKGRAGRRAVRRAWREERDASFRATLAAQPPRRRFLRRRADPVAQITSVDAGMTRLPVDDDEDDAAVIRSVLDSLGATGQHQEHGTDPTTRSSGPDSDRVA